MSPSHRARRTLGSLARAAFGPAVAVAGVLALIGLLLFLNGRPGPAAGSGPVMAAAAGTPSRPPTSPPGPAAASEATGPAASATASASVSAAASAPASAAPAPALPVLTVLNNSRITGLAHRAAAQFAAAGWPVGTIGNFTGRIAATTVYYPPGLRSAAEQLAARFPGLTRVLPRFAGLPGSGLTVVLTRYYAAAAGG